MNLKLLPLFLLLVTTFLNAQIVNIPDPNFKMACVNFNVVDFDGDGLPESDVDTNNDGEIQVSEAEAVQFFFPRSANIASLEGIEAFVNLTKLNCSQNALTSLDISQNILLEELGCFFNDLTSLDVSMLPNLKILDCDLNDLTVLNVSQNPNLEHLHVPSNEISTIDLSQNPLLANFDGAENNFTDLDFSQNPNLDVVSLEQNEISAINFSQNPLLRIVDLHQNSLETIDLSLNTNLEKLWCYENNLNSLNIKNGNNTMINLLDAENNPNLSCIEVDDPVFANSQSTWKKDDGTIYSENCLLGFQDFSHDSIVLFPNPANETIFIEPSIALAIQSWQIYDMQGKRVLESSSMTNSIDVSKLETGLFFINIKSQKGKITKRFLKQ